MKSLKSKSENRENGSEKKKGMENANDYEKIDILAQRACRGCRACEEELVEMFTPLVVSKARMYFGKATEDLVQDGKLRLVELIRAFDPQKGTNFCGYAKYMISTFYWNAKRRDMSRAKTEGAAGSESDYAESAVSSFRGIECAELNMLVDELPDIQRRLVRLVYYEGLSIIEASREMEISYPYALKIKSWSIKSLRDHFTSFD